MPTSGVTTWSVTALDFIKASMGLLGILDPSEDPDADEAEDCLDHLNGYLKSLAVRGVSLFRETSTTETTTGAVASVTLDPDVRSVSTVRLVVSATNERRLFPVDRTTYFNLPNKAQAGTPSLYYLDRQRDAAVLYLWPVSATAATIKLDYDRLPETVTALTETLDVRQEFHEALWANLAIRIAPLFGVQVPPQVVAMATSGEAMMLDAERPDAYRFETDYDYSYA